MKKRHLEILDAAIASINEAGGIETIDNLALAAKSRLLRELYETIVEKTDCHHNTAKRNTAKALSILRGGQTGQWGGKRPGSGRPKIISADLDEEK